MDVDDLDLCAGCAPPPAQNTLADPGADIVPFFEVCARCGPGWFDRDGRKVRNTTPQELALIRVLFGGVV